MHIFRYTLLTLALVLTWAALGARYRWPFKEEYQEPAFYISIGAAISMIVIATLLQD